MNFFCFFKHSFITDGDAVRFCASFLSNNEGVGSDGDGDRSVLSSITNSSSESFPILKLNKKLNKSVFGLFLASKILQLFFDKDMQKMFFACDRVGNLDLHVSNTNYLPSGGEI